jgi:hypothetical protein
MVKYFGILSLLAGLLMAACSPERKIARNYVDYHIGNGVMIVPLYELYKDNLTIRFDTAVHYNTDQFDSIAWVQSCYIRRVSDSVFLTGFTNNLIEKLTADGYDVYMDGSSDVFLSLPDPKWIVQIAQLQLNEQHTVNYYELYPVSGGYPYTDSLRINKVSLSSWLDVSRANTGNKQVLYLEGYIQDDLRSGVNFNLLDLGRKHAEFLFDYFMNDYIRENIPSGNVKRQYFRYDHKSKSVKKGLKEKFEVVN